MASTQTTARRLREAGEDVRERRLNLGLSPEGLGAKAEVSGRTIRRIEDGGRPTVRVMFQLAKELDCQVTDLWPL